MGLVLTQEGGLALWQQLLGIATIGIPNVHLFGAPHVPAPTDTYATYAAIELAQTGYAPIALVNPAVDWTLAPTSTGAQAAYLQLSWSLPDPFLIYGYWLADQANQHALWAERFGIASFSSWGSVFLLQLPPTLAS